MTVTASLLLDLVVLLFLILFFVQGVRRGFILTLCSLLAVFLALAGGWFLVHQYSEPLQEKLEPVILEHFAPDQDELDSQASGADPSLPEAVQEQLGEAAYSMQMAVITQQCKVMSALAAKAILFLGGFVAVLLIWIALCHALDLVARLPGLHFVNRVLGGILGLIKGLLLLMVLRWALCDLLNLIPETVQQESCLLPVLDYLTVFHLPGR